VAETNYALETHDLQIRANNPIPIIIEPCLPALNRSVGLPANEDNLGLYWDGVIRVLSPQAWLGSGPEVNAIYRHQGPLPQELRHALLNLKADRN
jgi:hypothetical protein